MYVMCSPWLGESRVGGSSQGVCYPACYLSHDHKGHYINTFSLTFGVDAKAEVNRVARALGEDEEYHHQHGRKYAELDHQQPVLWAAVLLVRAVHVPRP